MAGHQNRFKTFPQVLLTCGGAASCRMRTIILITGLLLAGCAAEPEAPAGPAKTDEISQAAVGFSQCMRDKGYQVPDPTFDENGLPVFDEPEKERVEAGKYRTDRQECRAPLNEAITAAGVPNTKGTPEQWLAFARCMRENGVDMADPTPDNRFVIDKNAYDSPSWATAADTCKDTIPPAMRSMLTERPGEKGGLGK
jgi:hypothetical protein